MRRRKQMVVSILLLLCLALTGVSASAADERLGTVVDGSLLTDETEAIGYANPKLRGIYFSYGFGSVTIASGSSVNLGGTTAAYQNVDQIQVKMFLQKLVGEHWEHVLTMGPRIKYGASMVSNSREYQVTRGYYYRAYGHHIVIEGETKEAAPSYSNGIWVG